MAERRIVLVGTHYSVLPSNWNEHPGSFDEVLAKRIERAEKERGNAHPEEIIEVVVVRSVRLKTEVTVEGDVPEDGGLS